MTQPTAEAYEAALRTWRERGFGSPDRPGAPSPIVDAVWPLAVAEGRRLEAERLADATVLVQCEHPELDTVLAERERLAPLVEAAKAWRAGFAHDVRHHKGLLLTSESDDLIAAVDALTRGDTDND